MATEARPKQDHSLKNPQPRSQRRPARPSDDANDVESTAGSSASNSLSMDEPREMPTPPRVRRSEATRRIRGAAAVADTLTTRDRLMVLAEQVKAGAGNPQRAQFIESSISDSLDEASAASSTDRWLSAEGATWALGWMARARRAGGSAGGLLEALVREARAAAEILRQGDTAPARFVLTLARLFTDIEACRRLEPAATESLAAEIDRLVSPHGIVNVANGGETVRRVVRWTTCREVAAFTGDSLWNAATDRRWREAATAAVRLLGRQGRQIVGSGLMPLCFTAPLLDAVAALKGRRGRTVEMLRKPRANQGKPTHFIRRDLNDPTAAVATLRTGWDADALRVLIDYRQPTPRLEIAAGDRMLVEGPWQWTVAVDDEPLEPEGPWTVSCWESGRKATYLEITAPLPGGRQFERAVVLLPQDRVLLLADAVTTPDDTGTAAQMATAHDPDTGWLRYTSTLPLAAGLAAEPADETREMLIFDTGMRFMALPLALQEWRVPGRGSLTHEPGGLRLAQQSAGRRLYAPLWLDCTPARIGQPLTWRQLTVADTRQNLGPYQATGFRVQSGLEQWLLYRSLDAPRNRTLLGCNVACEFLLGHLKPRGTVVRTLEIQ